MKMQSCRGGVSELVRKRRAHIAIPQLNRNSTFGLCERLMQL
jgi:hypothetical protein